MDTTRSAGGWTRGQKFVFRYSVVYVLLFITSFSFPHELLPDIGGFFSPFYEKLSTFCIRSILHLQPPYTTELISDSTGLYVHAGIVALLALIAAVVWGALDARRPSYRQGMYAFFVVLRYYLAIQLLMYGISKIFKAQFYLPEPNTLYTTVGNTHKDLLFWTMMGSSYGYTVALGILETLAAFLLFFRRTLLIGALVSFGIMLNVLGLNLCFDISVKLYSFFLLILCVMLVVPDLRRLLQVLLLNRATVAARHWAPTWTTASKRWFYYGIKFFVIAFILADGLFPYVRSGNYNDDRAPRPAFHGAYQARVFVLNADTLPPLLTDTLRWRRAFVHRQGYFIIQGMNDAMRDFEMEVDTVSQTWRLERKEEHLQIHLKYEAITDSLLFLHGKWREDSIHVLLQRLNLQQLPLLQNEFGWTIDQPY